MSAVVSRSPYVGLRRFEATDHPLYFGREGEVSTVLQRLGHERFIAVLGESGSGKSSLLRAGVVPALHRGVMQCALSNWRVAITQPREDPIGRLARSLLSALADDVDQVIDGTARDSDRSAEVAESVLRSSSQGILDLVQSARLGPNERVLIVVDQFEELFRFHAIEGGSDLADDAHAFVGLLRSACRSETHAVYVMITMRSDFLGDCARFRGLPTEINRGQHLIARLTREELRSAVCSPAAVCGLNFDPMLVTQILNEVGDDPRELPVLQHALRQTWRKWHDTRENGDTRKMISVEHYVASGGLSGALSLHATETYNDLPADRRAIAQRLFRALIKTDMGGQTVRRATRFRRLTEVVAAPAKEVQAVMNHFAADGREFLSIEHEETETDSKNNSNCDDQIVDLTHESLITRWDLLHGWARQEFLDAELYQNLARDAELNKVGRRSVYRDPELGLALKWRAECRPSVAWAERYHPGFEGALDFLARGESSARVARRNRLIWAGFGVVVLLTIAGGLAWTENLRAGSEAQKAEIATLRAENLLTETERLNFRVKELEEKNPGLSQEAGTLRSNNRELQWSIFQLQQSAERFEVEIRGLENNNKSLNALQQRVQRDIQDLKTRARAVDQRLPSLRQSRDEEMEKEQRAKEGWQAARAVNAKLRQEAIVAGLVALVVDEPKPEEVVTQIDNVAVTVPSARPASLTIPSDGTDKLRFELRQLELENLRLQKTIQELRVENERLHQQQSAEQARVARLTGRRNQLVTERTRLENGIVVLESEKSDATRQLSRLQDQETTLQDEIARLRRTREFCEAQIEVLQVESQALQRALSLR